MEYFSNEDKLNRNIKKQSWLHSVIVK